MSLHRTHVLFSFNSRHLQLFSLCAFLFPFVFVCSTNIAMFFITKKKLNEMVNFISYLRVDSKRKRLEVVETF